MKVFPRLVGCASIVGMLLIATGCQPVGSGNAGAAAAYDAIYRCGDQRVAAAFDGDALTLELESGMHRLAPVRSASGARYATGTDDRRIVFWDKGGRARLRLGQEPARECERLRDGTARHPLPFEARGNEPGWLLTLTEKAVRLEYAYGSKKASAPRPEPAATSDGYRYRITTEAHDLRVRIQRRTCVDSMSGMYFPATVTLSIDGDTLDGCGGDPARLLTGETWVIEDITGEGVIDASRMTLDFQPEGRLAGHASCNQYTSSYSLNGDLDIGPITSTRKACAPALMQQERAFLRLLREARRFMITDTGALRLVTLDGNAITARRSAD